VLPQAVAFATIAGEYGLYAAMVPAVVAALWGSSWHLMSGPATAISIVVFATSVGTLIAPEKGIFLGILVSLLFYLYRTSQPSIRELVPSPAERDNPRRKFVPASEDAAECPQMTMLRVEGSIFFGAVEHVQQHFRNVDEADPQKKHLLLTSRAIGIIDLAGAELLAKEAARRRKLGGGLYLVGVQPDLCEMLRRSARSTPSERSRFSATRATPSRRSIRDWTAISAATARRGFFANATARCRTGRRALISPYLP
jgi:MFS superfamily sulfate permease-like transporter